jgi:membrane fusion protein, copper/silver efflux system
MDRNDKRQSTWQKIKLVIEVIEVRLRFILILVVTALFIGYWDTIKNYWEKWTRPAEAGVHAVASDQEFYCPMHPQVVRTSLEPNGEVPKCPICGMPLSLRKKGQAAPLPKGVTGRVQLSPERIQLAGIQTTEVTYQPLVKEITTVGNVAYDESRLARVVSRVSGYVEKLYVNKTFTWCKAGEPLAEIYSPDLYSTAEELLLASHRTGGIDLAASARKRLELLGVSDEEINALVKSGTSSPRLLIRSPQQGYVMVKDVVKGSRVEPGMTLLEVADLSTVWIEAEVYEKDMPLVHQGQMIEATVDSLPGRTFVGQVLLVYPRVSTTTRTVGVRFSVDNPKGELRPGMFATVRISTLISQTELFQTAANPQNVKHDDVLAVPERAVVDTGAKQIVFVEREPGLFEGVEVQLGPRAGAMYPVLKGLKAGDRVAAAGAFLIDAETRLNPSAAAAYFGASGGPQTGAAHPAAAPRSSSETHTADQSTKRPAAETPEAEPDPGAEAARENLAALSPEDRKLAEAQRLCPITNSLLGSMGPPEKVVIKGQVVFLCCGGCKEEALKNPDKTLEKVAKLKNTRDSSHDRKNH